MMKRSFLIKTAVVIGFSGLSLLNSRIAFAEAAAPIDPQNLISDGQPIELSRIEAKITPPKGWEVKLNSGGFSAVMQEKKIEAKPGNRVLFQKNITLAVIQRAAPIDEIRAQELQEELTKSVANDSSAVDFKILEHRFFNFRGLNDGLMLYSTVKLAGFEMMQMHVLVSNDERQYLMTYTDFADQFQKTGANFDMAWNAMTSLQIAGAAPDRYEELLRYSSLAGGLVVMLSVLGFIRRRRAKLDYDREADEIYRDETPFVSDSDSVGRRNHATTVSGMWNLSTARKGQSNDGWFTDDIVGIAQR